MKQFNCDSLKNLPVPEELIEKAVAIPETAAKTPAALPWFRNTKLIAAAASVVLVTAIGSTVYFIFGNKNPIPVAEYSPVTASELQTERSSDGTQLTEAPTAPAGSDRPDGRQNASSVPTQPATQPAVQVLIDSRGRQIVVPASSAAPSDASSPATTPAATEPRQVDPTDAPRPTPTQKPVVNPTTAPEPTTAPTPTTDPATEKPTAEEEWPDPPVELPTEIWDNPTESPWTISLTATIPYEIRSQQLPVYCKILRSNGTLVGDPDLFSDQHRASAYFIPKYEKAVYDPIGNGLPLTYGLYTYYFYDGSGEAFATGTFRLD